MLRFTQKFGSKALLRVAALTAAGIGLSGCVYDVGLGYASDGYGSGYYDCDPYSPFDNYYDCDNGYGFSNIGYGGGWYDSYWYPGYGFYLFDNYGRRHNMRDNDRRYWGERRHHWYRENRGRHQGGGYRDGHNDGYRGNNGYADPRPRGGSQNTDGQNTGGRGYGRPHPDGNRDDHPRGDGQRRRDRNWQGDNGNGANAVPQPAPVAAPQPGGGDGRRGDRGGRQRWNGNDGQGAVQVPRPDGGGEGRGRGYRQPPPPSGNEGQSAAPRPAPEPSDDSPRQQRAPRQGGDAPERLPD